MTVFKLYCLPVFVTFILLLQKKSRPS